VSLIRRRTAWSSGSELVATSGQARKSVSRWMAPFRSPASARTERLAVRSGQLAEGSWKGKMQNRQGKTGQDGDESFVEVFPVTPCRCGDSFFSQFCGMLD